MSAFLVFLFSEVRYPMFFLSAISLSSFDGGPEGALVGAVPDDGLTVPAGISGRTQGTR